MLPDTITTFGIIDSSPMICAGFSVIIPMLSPHFKPVFKANCYEDLFQQTAKGADLPSFLFVGVTNPIDETIKTLNWLTENYPEVIKLSLSTEYPEGSKYLLIQAGCKGFLIKDDNNDITMKAITDMLNYGYINNSNNNMVLEYRKSYKRAKPTGKKLVLLQLICSKDSYKEIAEKLFLSPRTIAVNSGLLFEELEVSNRYELICLAYHEHWVE